MDHQFKAISLSHKYAPLHVRELMSLDETGARRLLKLLKEYIPANDILVLSTCNRTEVYYSSEQDLNDEILKLIGIEKNLPVIQDYKDYFEKFIDSHAAVKHLFRVSIGLESKVVGDMQITNQVKKAYQWAVDEDLAGPFLHRLLHTIFYTNKKVVQSTPFRDGAASVSYASAELVDELTFGIEDPKVLVIGLGEIGKDVCRNLSKANRKNVTIINRTEAKAKALAEECGYNYLPFKSLYDSIAQSDVIISSVVKEEPLITKKLIQSIEILTFKYFIDLAIPRSIEAEIEEVPGVLLYNIDQIQNKATEALNKRLASIPDVEHIIESSIEEFYDWTKEMIVSPTINKLKNALEQIRQEELTRYLKGLNREESEIVDKITKGMMQKILKLPVLQLKAACKRGEAENLIDVINELFDLEKQITKEKK